VRVLLITPMGSLGGIKGANMSIWSKDRCTIRIMVIT
jgi:hypothetical protein